MKKRKQKYKKFFSQRQNITILLLVFMLLIYFILGKTAVNNQYKAYVKTHCRVWNEDNRQADKMEFWDVVTYYIVPFGRLKKDCYLQIKRILINLSEEEQKYY